MRTFILLSALPGSGKSTWARRYASEHEGVYIVSSDEVRKKVTGSVAKFDSEPLVWHRFLEELNSHPEDGATVIADATNLQNKYRRYYREMTPGFDRYVLVYFDIPFDICRVQNKMREGDRIVPEKAMERMRDELEPIDEETRALYDEVIVLGPDYVSDLVRKIKES